MSTTSIEWATDSLNPGIYGCAKTSPACANCYAMIMAARLALMGQERYQGTTTGRGTLARWTGLVKLDPVEAARQRVLRYPRKRGAGRKRVFVTSMADVLHADVPIDWIGQVVAAMGDRPDIDWLVLTKRAERLPELAHWLRDPDGAHPAWPSNVWIGVTVEDQQRADERIPYLLQVPAAVRFLSVEPLLDPVDLTNWLCDSQSVTDDHLDAPDGAVVDGMERIGSTWERLARVAWVIAGGESGPRARPTHPDWFRAVRDQCQDAGTAFFFKQWGAWSPGWLHHGNDLPYSAICKAEQHQWSQGWPSFRVGKKKAGRMLDGRTWDELPGQNR